jgi:hypothetical protein
LLFPLDASTSPGSYTVKVSNAVGNVTSTPVVIAVDPNLLPPVILGQPASQNVVPNSTATFNVAAYAQGGTLSYQWLLNGSTIGGAAGSSYSTPALGTSDSGNNYSVVVTSTLGSLTSSVISTAASVIVAAPTPVTISAQPQNVTVQAGNTATFTVSASAGTNTLSYQWLRGSTVISGATAASYTVNPAQLGDSGSTYSVVITSAQGTTATSASATLTVTSAPVPVAIAAQPQNATVQAGTNVQFNVAVSGGNGTYTYQWARNGTPINGATVTGSSTAYGYVFSAASADNGASYTVTVTSNGSSVTSTAAVLTVTPVNAATDYYLVANAGPQVNLTSTYLSGSPVTVTTSTVATQGLSAVNSTGSPAAAVAVESAGQASSPFAFFLEGSISGTTLSNPRLRLQLYVKNNRLRLLDQAVPSGSSLGSVQVSTFDTSQFCGDGTGVPMLSDLLPQTQAIGTPKQNYVFIAMQGVDQICSPSNNTVVAVRMDMSATTPPVGLAGRPVMPIYSSAGALSGLISLNGSAMALRDANLVQTQASLFTVDAASFQSYGVMLGSAEPGIWLFSEGGKLWGVNLAAPGTRTQLYQVAAGEVFSPSVITDGSTAYLAVTNVSAGSTRLIKVDTSLAPATTFATLNTAGSLALGLTPTRLVYSDQSSPSGGTVHSIPRSGTPTDSTIYIASGGQIQVVYVSGENAYIQGLVVQGGSAMQQVVIVNSDGTNGTTLANTGIVSSIQSNSQNVALGIAGRANNPYALMLSTSPAGTAYGTMNNATLTAVEGATRNTLVTYGKLPAAPAGVVFPTSFVGLAYGQGALLSFFPVTGNAFATDLYFFNTGAAGLTLSTNFNSITP